MDIDTFLRERRPSWRALDVATRRTAESALQVEQLLDLYQQASTDLSIARTRYGDPALTAELTQLVARAQARVMRPPRPTWQRVGRAVVIAFPGAVWHMRRAVAASAAIFLVAALVTGWWVANRPDVQDAIMTPAAREAFLNEDFEDYYSSSPAAEFATTVSTNNIRVGALAVGSGVLLGAPTAAVLAFNGINVGVAGGLFVSVGRPGHFFGLILPHGLLELTAVILAGGAGLHLGWSLVNPGDRRRGEAFTSAATRALRVVAGLVVVFLVAGQIEAFVTPSGLAPMPRVAVGAAAWLAFLGFLGWLGPAGAAASHEQE